MGKRIVLIIFFIIFSAIFLNFSDKLKLTAIINTGQNISLSLFAYNGERNPSSSSIIDLGDTNSPSNTFNASSNISAIEDTDYRIYIKGLNAGNNFLLKEQRINPLSSNIYSIEYQFVAPDTQINGTFFSPENNFELWKIWVEQQGKLSNIVYFYLTKKSFSSNPTIDCALDSTKCQYNIEFSPSEITFSSPNNPKHTALIAQWNKIYCLDNLLSGRVDFSPAPGDKISNFPAFISKLNFPNYESLSKFTNIIIKPHIFGTEYTAQLTGSILSNKAKLKINSNEEDGDNGDNGGDGDNGDNGGGEEIITTYNYKCYFGFYREEKCVNSSCSTKIILNCDYAEDKYLCLAQILQPCSIQIHE